MIATTEANERLVLPTAGPASDKASWRAKPSLQPEFDSVLDKIRSLAGSGLTSWHVLGDFVKRRIAPLKQRPRPAWSFTGLNDCSRTHRGEGSDLTQEALEVLVRNVTGDTFIPENLILPQSIVPLCEDPARVAVLATLPTLDDGGLAPRQTGGDPNRGLRIPGTSGDQATLSAAGSGATTKGKQAAASSAAAAGSSRAQSSSGASSGDVGRRRLLRGDGTLVSEPAAKRQRSSEGAGQGSSRAAGPHGSSGATGPPPSPPRNSSRRQQEQQQQEQPQEQRLQARGRQQQQQERPRVAPMPQPQVQQQRAQARVTPVSQLQGQQQQQQQQQPQEKRPGLRGRWVPGTSGLVSSCSLPLRRCSVLLFF